MSTTMHWAADLIGRPYTKDPALAAGPDAFNCWGLVRWIFAHVHGVAMPVVQVGQAGDDRPDNVAAIKRAAVASGWKPCADKQPAENDIVLMNGPDGRHVGVMVRANGALLLLHCVERSGVCAQPLAELPRLGFSGFEFWRRAA